MTALTSTSDFLGEIRLPWLLPVTTAKKLQRNVETYMLLAEVRVHEHWCDPSKRHLLGRSSSLRFQIAYRLTSISSIFPFWCFNNSFFVFYCLPTTDTIIEVGNGVSGVPLIIDELLTGKRKKRKKKKERERLKKSLKIISFQWNKHFSNNSSPFKTNFSDFYIKGLSNCAQ